MDSEQFVTRLLEFLIDLPKEQNYGAWFYTGPTRQNFGTPAGAWDSERFRGYRFKHLKENFEFIVRPVPEHIYLVIESVSTSGQLANVGLSKPSKYKVEKGKGYLYEDYTMTVGLGRRRVEEVKSEFKKMGMNEQGLISSFDTQNPNFKEILLDILGWATIRERVKLSIQELKNNEGDKETVQIQEQVTDVPEEAFSANYATYSHVTASQMRPAIGVTQLAQEMSEFIANLKGEAPMQIGLFGRWGRGKTFLFDQIWKVLRRGGYFYRVDFHAWKHQETPASWGYLYQAFAEKYYSESTWFGGRWWRTIRLNWKREGKNEVIAFLFTLVGGILLYFNQDNLENLSNYIIGGVLSITFLYGVIQVFQRQSSKARELYKKFARRHSYVELLGMQAEIQKELKTLLLIWIKKKKGEDFSKRVLLFVDDLDRCSEERIIQVVDSLRVMLEDPEIAQRVIVVIAVDERILRRAIRMKYENLLDHDQKNKEAKLLLLTREYLDKLFLSGIKLGELNSNERIAIFSALTEGKVEAMEDLEKRIKNQTEVSPTPPTEEVVVEPKEAEVIKEEDIEYVGRNPNYEISREEEKILQRMISELDDLTPRQIRILYLRYIFLRTFLTKLSGNVEWNSEAATIAVDFIQVLHGKDLFNQTVEEAIREELKQPDNALAESWSKLNEKGKEDYLSVLQMVVPY
ncbi:MAG: hypothetical protein Crog4KO_09000 [Crocinitomicaceae bacterium]